jgi:DNA polymerase V
LEITQFAIQGLEKIFVKGYSYKKAGVILMDFCPENEVQQTIFESSNPKHKKLMKAIDKLNTSIGQQKVKLAIQDQDRVWKMKQEKLSPRYTTRLSEIININAK